MATKRKTGKKAYVPLGSPAADSGDWRARDDMQTLKRAEEIMADKKRYAAAKACMAEEAGTTHKMAARHKVKVATPYTAKNQDAYIAARTRK